VAVEEVMGPQHQRLLDNLMVVEVAAALDHLMEDQVE
jgi:hypothetical protein